ncbi:MAG: alpha/beta fold hydrolase [Bacteroidota bacterium]
MKVILIILGILLGLYVLAVGLLYVFQEKMLFLPTKLPADHQFHFPFSQAGEMEEIFIDRDSAHLHNLCFSPDSPRAAVIYFHGNGGCLQDWGQIAPWFLDENIAVWMLDYREYGKSSGPQSEDAMLADALAVYDAFAKRFPDIPHYSYGRSLGGSFASYVAANRPVDRLILESTFMMIDTVAEDRFGWVPTRHLLRYHLPVVEFLHKVNVPTYLIQGTADQVVPIRNGRGLAREHQLEDPYYIEIPGGGHNNLSNYPAFQRWLEMVLR